MEVLDNYGPTGFLCHRCRHVLTFEADRNAGGHEQSTRLNDQFKFISELLPKIDAVHIPECDFDRALSKSRPVIRDSTHQRTATIPVDSGADRPMAVKGLTNTGPQSIAVNISTSEGASEAEKEAERARKEKLAQQNALPSWMSNSTVTGDSFAGTSNLDTSTTATSGNHTSADDKAQVKTVDAKASAQIDDIFEKLKAEQAAARLREEEEEEEGEYESEDDSFEDVFATGNTSALGTPGAMSIKRETSRESSGDGESSDERINKRVKTAVHIKQPDQAEDSVEDDDDEDVEFEDV